VGPLERLRRLEDARARLSEADDRSETVSEERRAALRESLRRGWERAEAEAAAGDTRRLHALEDLERSMRERVEKRRRRQRGD
jgi:hypothetical protein